MRIAGFRAGVLGCALLATTVLTAPALAQTGQTTPPQRRGVDANGVDLISGDYVFSFTEAAIGSGEGALALIRQGTQSSVTSNWQNIWLEQTVSGSVTRVTVILGGRSEVFEKDGSGAFTPLSGNRATLTGAVGDDYVYRASGGTTITFGTTATNMHGDSSFCAHPNANPHGCRGLALSLVRPNGARLDFDWDIRDHCEVPFPEAGYHDCVYAWRLAGVSNNFGYEIDFDFVTDSYSFTTGTPDFFVRTGASLSNANVSGETPLAVSYSHPSTGVTEVTVPGPTSGGLIWRFAVGSGTFGIRRPGSSSDDISVAFGSGGVTQVVRDGVTTDYERVESTIYEAPFIPTELATTTITQVDGDSNTADPETVVVANLDLGLIRSVTDPLDQETAYQHDSESRLTRVTAPEGNYVAYTYDARGNVTETRAVAKSGSGLADIVIEADYPSSCSNPVTCNRPTATRDALDRQTDYTYDSTHGGVLTVTAPAPSGSGTRPQTRYSYTQVTAVSGQPVYQLTGISACATGSTSSPTCVGTADESRTVIAYDSVNIRPTSLERRSGNTSGTGALSATTALAYNAYGDVTSVDGPLSGTGDTASIRYDGARRRVGMISPDPDGAGSEHPLDRRAQRITYRSDGQASAVETGTVEGISDSDWASMNVLQGVQIEFDASNRPEVQRLVSGSTTYALTQISYDGLGRVRCVAQRMNSAQFATSSLPSDNCTLDTEGDYGPDRITRLSYDLLSRAGLVETGVGTDAAATELFVMRSNNGQIQYAFDARNNISAFQYDGHDRLIFSYFPKADGSGVNWTDYEATGYDATGNVTQRWLRDGTSVAYTYDALGRLATRDPPGSELTVTYSYDLLNRMTGASQTGHSLSFTYDALGRRLTEAGPHGTRTSTFDVGGRRTLLTGSGSYAVGYSHLATGEIAGLLNGNDEPIAAFAYDDRGRRSSHSLFNGAGTTYTHDNVSRLTQMAVNSSGTSHDLTLDFTPNPAGQIASTARDNDSYAWAGHYAVNRNYTANGLNQYSAIGSITPTYTDSRGNLTSAGNTTYTYDSANRLVSTSSNVTLSYDPLGRLYEVATSGGATRRFAYDGYALIDEYDAAGNKRHAYIHGPHIDEPLIWFDITAGTFGTYQADERGSIVAVANSGGTGTAINTYDEYGIPGSGNAGAFQYTGQQWVPELGIYYYRARMYSPTLGRFLQTDPIGFAGGMNLYAYVLNDPVNLVDPSGLDPEDCPITQCGEPPVVCGTPSRNPANECYDGSYAYLFERMFGFAFDLTLYPPQRPIDPEQMIANLQERLRSAMRCDGPAGDIASAAHRVGGDMASYSEIIALAALPLLFTPLAPEGAVIIRTAGISGTVGVSLQVGSGLFYAYHDNPQPLASAGSSLLAGRILGRHVDEMTGPLVDSATGSTINEASTALSGDRCAPE